MDADYNLNVANKKYLAFRCLYCIAMQGSFQRSSARKQLRWDTEMQLLPTQVTSLTTFSFLSFSSTSVISKIQRLETEFRLPTLWLSCLVIISDLS